MNRSIPHSVTADLEHARRLLALSDGDSAAKLRLRCVLAPDILFLAKRTERLNGDPEPARQIRHALGEEVST
jgi:hypothetical protein